MRKIFKLMIGLGIFISAAIIGSGCAMIKKQEESKILVIKDSAIDIEQSSPDIRINVYKTFNEFDEAIKKIDTSNMQFAPEGYSGSTYDKNCVVFEITHVASFTLDAEHMISVAQHLNYLYVQYDSADSAIEAMSNIDKRILYASQNKSKIFGYVETC